jgi:hypothetical protein
MTRWRPGEADIEQLLANRDLQLVTGTVADGRPALERASHTLVSAQTLLETDPINAFVLAYNNKICYCCQPPDSRRPDGHPRLDRGPRRAPDGCSR